MGERINTSEQILLFLGVGPGLVIGSLLLMWKEGANPIIWMMIGAGIAGGIATFIPLKRQVDEDYKRKMEEWRREQRDNQDQ